MKRFDIKKMMALLLSAILLVGCFAMNISAATTTSKAVTTSVHMVLGMGRTTAIVEGRLSVKMVEMANSSKDENAMFSAPLYDSGKAYVPLRFLFEQLGYTVEWDSATSATSIRTKDGTVPIWYNDVLLGATKFNAQKVTIQGNKFTITRKDEDDLVVYGEQMKTFFGKTYMAVSDIERFGFIIYEDAKYGAIHIMGNTSSQEYDAVFEKVFTEIDGTAKQAKSYSFYTNLTKSANFTNMLNEYVSYGTNNNNHLNNSLALVAGGKKIIGITEKSGDKLIKVVQSGARQLAYASSGTKKYIYFVSAEDRKMYRGEFNASSGDVTKIEKVALPDYLEIKGFSQIMIIHDKLFFIAYDYAPYGGYVYVAQVGHEKDTTVRLTRHRAWNIHVTNDFKLYYTNLDQNCELYAIDLKDASLLNNMWTYPELGVVGQCMFSYGIQFFDIDHTNDSVMYYTDIDTGAINEVVNGVITKEIVKPNGYALYNFLNLYTANDSRILYYIEYPSGRVGNYNSCKVMAYDLKNNKSSTIYNSNSMLIELSIMEDGLYCTNSDYSELYRINLSSDGISIKTYTAE